MSSEATEHDAVPDISRFIVPRPEELRAMRKRCGLTLREAAERADVDKHTISKWERAKTSPRLGDAKTIVSVYREEFND